MFLVFCLSFILSSQPTNQKKTNQTKPNQPTNQTKPNQAKPNQTKPNHPRLVAEPAAGLLPALLQQIPQHPEAQLPRHQEDLPPPCSSAGLGLGVSLLFFPRRKGKPKGKPKGLGIGVCCLGDKDNQKANQQGSTSQNGKTDRDNKSSLKKQVSEWCSIVISGKQELRKLLTPSQLTGLGGGVLAFSGVTP